RRLIILSEFDQRWTCSGHPHKRKTAEDKKSRWSRRGGDSDSSWHESVPRQFHWSRDRTDQHVSSKASCISWGCDALLPPSNHFLAECPRRANTAPGRARAF